MTAPLVTCYACGAGVKSAAGLYRCQRCGASPQRYPTAMLPPSPRELFAAEDPTRTKPIDGRPIPIDRRVK